MQLTLVSGSHRKNSNSRKVANFIAKTIDSKQLFTAVHLLDLYELKLPLWDEGVWQGEQTWKDAWGPIKEKLRASDAIVLVSPEWGGMVPSGLKNFLLLCTHAELGHKPALIAAVSSGMGGAYPVAELRMSGYKNNRMMYVPDHVIVRNADKLLNGDEPADQIDKEVRERIGYAVSVLAEYAKALKLVRDSGVIDFKKYPNGQ